MCGSPNKTELIRALEVGSGIQYLLNEAYKILGNPVSMHDMDDKLLAYTENIITDDPYWNESVAYGAVRNETLEHFRTEYFVYDIVNSNIVTSLVSDKFKYDRLFGKIFIKDNIRVANACMIACKKPFEDDDPVAFEEFCKILSTEFGKSEFYQQYGKSYRETLIRQLIDGSFEDKKYYSARVEDIYKGLKAYLFLAVADISQCDCEYAGLTFFIDLFIQAKPEFKYYIYSDYIVIIMSADNPELNVIRDLLKFHSLFEVNNIYAGISSHFENLFELHKYYIEAVSALKDGLKNTNGQRIFLYDEIR